MLLMIDNYDSFTWNLVQYLGELGQEVCVRRNDAVSAEEVARLAPKAIVLSPGPCTPNEAGVCLELVARYASSLPILGVCLGHQVICQALGGRIVHAKRVMHGKVSRIHHDGSGVFAGLENPLSATRYHSLAVAPGSVPQCLVVNGWTGGEDGSSDGEADGDRDQAGDGGDGDRGRDKASGDTEIMSVRHREWPLHGLQFHPESIETACGHQLLANFLALANCDVQPITDALITTDAPSTDANASASTNVNVSVNAPAAPRHIAAVAPL